MTAHRPHIYLPEPWPDSSLPLGDAQRAHLDRVLRVRSAIPVSYTDGDGILGRGEYSDGVVNRGEESARERPTSLVMAVAAPKSRDRQRFVVEKLQEMGVARLRWLSTAHGEGHPPKKGRALPWAVSALEQSRGVWLMQVDEDTSSWSDLESPVVVCDTSGARQLPERAATVAIGPEGGWGPREIPEELALWSLGETILRVETATIVAAARLSGDNGNG